MEQRWKGMKSGADAEEFKQEEVYMDLLSEDWDITDEERQGYINTIDAHI